MPHGSFSAWRQGTETTTPFGLLPSHQGLSRKPGPVSHHYSSMNSGNRADRTKDSHLCPQQEQSWYVPLPTLARCSMSRGQGHRASSMREHQEVDKKREKIPGRKPSVIQQNCIVWSHCLARPSRTVQRGPAELSANTKALPSGTVHRAASSLVPTEHWNVVKTI